MANSVPLPTQDPIATPPLGFQPKKGDTNAFHMPLSWIQYFTAIVQSVSLAPARLQQISKVTQGASIPTTPLNLGVLSAGNYRVSYYLQITRAASVSSSLTFTLGWTSQTVAISSSGTALTGNTTTTFQQATIFIYSDGRSAINYGIAYASVGGTSMQYFATVVLEAVAA